MGGVVPGLPRARACAPSCIAAPRASPAQGSHQAASAVPSLSSESRLGRATAARRGVRRAQLQSNRKLPIGEAALVF